MVFLYFSQRNEVLSNVLKSLWAVHKKCGKQQSAYLPHPLLQQFIILSEKLSLQYFSYQLLYLHNKGLVLVSKYPIGCYTYC